MKVSRNNIFYRYLLGNIFDNWRAPDNLCPFMRKVMIQMVVEFLLGCTVAVFVFGAILDVLIVLGILNTAFLPVGWENFASAGAVLWCLVALMIVVGGILYFRDWYREYHPVDEYTEPSLVRAWAQAKHDKICPHLEFISD